MPDLEISNLPALAEAGVAGTDPLAIADISASETKKVTVTDLIKAGITSLSAGDISAAKIGTLGTDQVATGAIQDDAVTNDKIQYPSISLGGLTLTLGSTDATPALNLTDATNYPASSLTGTITNAQLAGSIANSKLTNSSVSFGGVSLALGGTDATPAFDLQDATGYKTTNLVGTITNAQLAGSIDVSKLTGSAISLGGVSVALGGTDATPAFNLTDATNYPTSALVGTITNAQLAGSIANAKLANSSVSLGGVSIALGGTDATPAFNLADATGYPTSSLVGTITNAQLAGSIDVSKLAGTTAISLGGVSIALGGTDATPAFNLTDATNYPAASLTGTISNAQLAGSIANAKLINSSVSFGGITVALGASDATPAFNLTDATDYPASSLTGTITNAQLAGSIAVSKLVSSSASVGGVTITLGTTDATPAFDLQDATGYPTSALVGTITNAQLAGSIAATKLVSGSITSTQLGANSVTDSELANNAVDTGAVQNGAITNDKVETSTSATTGLDGATKIRDATITPAKLNTSNLDRSINVASGNLGINNTITAATRSGITYNAQGLITSTAALGASDLPLATTSAVGGVSVGAGLSVNGSGALSISNSVTGATVSGITFNNQGQITAATALTSANLPVATTSAKGAVQITSGGGLTVDGSGGLTTSTSGVSAGTYQSVTVNNKGVITAGTALTASQIPDLAASKITSGSIDAARIGADSIDGTKLSNASTAVFQSIAQQGYPTAQFNGQILFDTVSEDAYIWDGNAWQAITTLTKGSLVFGGNFNANTSKMTACTSAGLAAGLAVGSNLPTPSSTTDGLYVVVDTAGTPSAPAPVVAFSPPDYILGVTNSAGSSWNEIDLSQTVAGQVASNITFTPYGQLSSTNVQDALQELETEKMGFAGGTLTGQLLIGNTGSLVFEGSTIDAYETTITVADPTSSDKTITFPDTTGTVITTGDTGTVTGTMLANGTIQNVDIKSDAAIAFSKLAALTSAQILVGNGSNVATGVAVTGDISINNAGLTAIATGVIVNADISGSAAITGSKITTGTTSAVGVLQLTNSAASTSTTTAATPAAVKTAKDAADAAATTANAALPTTGGTLTGNLILDNAKEVRFSEGDSDGANYTGLKAQAQSGDITLTLPAVAPTAGQVLKANASTPTTLEWGTDSATDSTKMPLAGGTFTGDVTFTGDSSNGLWDKSASAFVANLTGNVTGNTSGSSGSCTGNAATATALATARTIGGVSFDGTANINLPGVNTSGTQDTSGTAALATSFTVTANNSTDETVYPLFADGATGSQGAETDTGLTYNPSTGLLTAATFSGSGASLTHLNLGDSNNTGTVAAARLGSGSSVSTKFLRGDNTWQTINATPEGTAILSTGESGGTKFLREDGDGTCSWQTATTSAAGSNTQVQYNSSGSFAGSANLTFDGTHLSLADQSKLKLGASGDLEVFTDVGGDGMAHITSDLNLIFNVDQTLSFRINGSTKLSIANNGVNGANINSLPAATCFSSSGQIPVARLGTGTASSSNFLRGDGSWAAAGLTSDAEGNTVGGTNAGDSFTGTDATKNTLLGYDAGTAVTTGDWNVALGHSALKSATTAGANIAIGFEAGLNLSTASGNILIGQLAAKNGVVTGAYNVSVGYSTGYQLTSGHTNTFLGSQAGYGTTTGYENTYIGQDAGGGWEGTGNNNIAVGHACMQGAAVSGNNNIGIGQSAFNALTSGTLNIAIGYQACLLQATGSDSVAIGYQALNNATSGENIGIGRSAGKGVTTGTDNIAIGRYAVYGSALTGTGNIGIGRHAFRYGTASSANNVCIGRESGGYTGTQYISEGSNNICIGYQAEVSTMTTSNEATIGNSSITKFRVPGVNFVLKDNGGTPSSGQVLTADGSGEGYWAAVAGGVSSDAQFNTVGGTDAGSSFSGTDAVDNTLFGYKAGEDITTGDKNTVFGSEAGKDITTGEENVLIGHEAGKSITTVRSNVYIGHHAGRVVTTGANFSVCIGYFAGENMTSSNDFIGGYAGTNTTTGNSNVGIGLMAYKNGNGSGNTVIGNNAGDTMVSGNYNVVIGKSAASAYGVSSSFSNNVIIGKEAAGDISSGSTNIIMGSEAGAKLTTGSENVLIGTYAKSGGGTTFKDNICIGRSAGGYNNGDDIIAIGSNCYSANDSNVGTATNNIAIGNDYVMGAVTTGSYNISIGKETLYSLTSGEDNTVIGMYAGKYSTTGTKNTFLGVNCGKGDSGGSTGGYNVAVGHGVMKSMTTANSNVCIGYDTAETLSTGEYNIAIGSDALKNATSSVRNICIGRLAGKSIVSNGNNTLVGYGTGEDLTGSNSVMIGFDAGKDVTSGSNNQIIGYDAGTEFSPSGKITTSSNNVVLGNNSINNLYCADTSISSSDVRDKTDIEDFTHGLTWIKELRPVTYRWDRRTWYATEGSPKGTPDGSKKRDRLHIGFLAQEAWEVEKKHGYADKKDNMLIVNQDEDDADPSYGIKYERLVPVLVNAIKELSAKVEALEAKLA